MAHSSNLDGQQEELYDSLTALSLQHRREDAADQLSLFVFLSDGHELTDGEPDYVRNDLSWLQFIDGLGVYFVFDAAATAVDCSRVDSQDCVVLVDKRGRVQHQWDTPANSRDLRQIRQTVERRIDEEEVQ